MPSCKICEKSASDGIHLSNGGIIHESCLNSIQGKEEDVKKEIYAQQEKLNRLRGEIEKREGLGFKIISIFSKPEVDTFDIERELLKLKEIFPNCPIS